MAFPRISLARHIKILVKLYSLLTQTHEYMGCCSDGSINKTLMILRFHLQVSVNFIHRQ